MINADIIKTLYELQKSGDLLYDNMQDISNTFLLLRNTFHYSSYPILRTETIGLNRYFITIYSNYILNTSDIYDLFEGSVLFIYRNLLNPYSVNILLSTPLKEHFFTKPLDYLQDYDVIYYYNMDKIYDHFTYPIDYSSFNFEKRKFQIRDTPREYFSFNFDPTKTIESQDLKIIKEKQMYPSYTLKEISKELEIPYLEAKNRVMEHIIPNGIISSYVLTLQKPEFILLIYFEEKDTISYISRIPELYLIYQTRNGYLAHIIGQNKILFKYIEYITRIKRKDQIDLNIIPHNYIKSFPIPENRYIEGKWNFDVEEMIKKAQYLVKKFKK
ncbi:hypothetical protein [Acidianus manzaensis]|uniref:AsnC family protein n=1 Tax=Acidianus manzaensis TaxID=282676 RepID=A0A1W6K2N6_9CREN|nr:hypothetical protein [Acidianus manzaensis]ARM76722.1 hypothetical protein B6F84_12335 [Acidianus manzaensis]